MIVNLLNFIFIIILFYQIFIFNNNFNPILEGLTSARSSQNVDILKLEQKNAGTIAVLKQQLDSLLNVDKEITGLNTNVATLTNKVIELSETQNINKQLNSEKINN
jgi:hypothetical protein